VKKVVLAKYVLSRSIVALASDRALTEIPAGEAVKAPAMLVSKGTVKRVPGSLSLGRKLAERLPRSRLGYAAQNQNGLDFSGPCDRLMDRMQGNL